MPRTSLQMLIIVLLALVPATLAGLLHPRRPHFRPPQVADGERSAHELRASGRPIIWIDARSWTDFQAGHVEGAYWLRDESWEDSLMKVLEAWQPGSVLVVYCDAADASDRRHVASRLKQETGLEGIYTLKGSWRQWPNCQTQP